MAVAARRRMSGAEQANLLPRPGVQVPGGLARPLVLALLLASAIMPSGRSGRSQLFSSEQLFEEVKRRARICMIFFFFCWDMYSNIKRLLLITTDLKVIILVLFSIWEDTGIWGY